MAANRVELLKQICSDCTKVMHKRCVNAANDGKDPCKDCLPLLCNNCAALVACYDLCDSCYAKICPDCNTKARKTNLNANFDKKCYDVLCGRCLHVLQCWCVRGIKTHLSELGISDSSSESDSECSSDSASSEELPRKPAKVETKSTKLDTKSTKLDIKSTKLETTSAKLATKPIKLETKPKSSIPNKAPMGAKPANSAPLKSETTKTADDLLGGLQKLSIGEASATSIPPQKPKGIVGNKKHAKKDNKKQ